MGKALRKVMVAALACVLVLAGCGAAGPAATGKKSVVCTTFASYDWVRQIVGESDAFELTLLLDDGIDLHSFEPSVKDLATVSDADLFVYVGGESDAWVSDALEGADGVRAVSLMEQASALALEEETVEGMQETGAEEEEGALDEHVWLSVRRAASFVDMLAGELSALDPAGDATYRANAEAYIAKLNELDARYQQMRAEATRDTVVFCDRFPFRYLMADYGISYYAAFAGCSAETEASFATIAFLADKVNELGLNVVLICEDSDGKIARAVTDAAEKPQTEVLMLDSLQSTSLAEAKAGRTYLTAMQQNLELLAQALS